MEKRVESLEGRVDRLEDSQADLKQSDKTQWEFLKELKEQLNDQKTEMKVKMDSLSNDVGSLRSETAARSGEVQGILSVMTKQNDDLLSIVKATSEAASGVQKETIINKRTWWQGFFQVVGISLTSAAGVIGALAAAAKIFGW